MFPSKIWQIKEQVKTKTSSKRREEIFHIILKNRQIKTAVEKKSFLNPKKPQDFSLKELGIKTKEVNKAIKLIKEAIKNQEGIVVYGDYDTDGICATAIVWEALSNLGASVLPFIPDREEHGYGLSVKGIKAIMQTPKYNIKDSGLMVTVDNGIVAHKAVEFAKKKGIKVIITDHHQAKLKAQNSKLKTYKKKDLPPAEAVIHSTKLSGSGVAYFFIREIFQKQDFLSSFLELAAIGTIADLMPLQGVNRALVKFGIKALQKTSRIGLKALCQVAGVEAQNLGVYQLSYMISPRINAMGRISESLDSLRLLCTKDKVRARKLARVLDRTNRLRQNLMTETFLHAKEKIGKKPQEKLLFVTEKNYNQGIIGLVAGKLTETFYRPTVVVTIVNSFAKGSARSIKGFNIIKALRNFEPEFLDLGGHKMAAGFTIKNSYLKRLGRKMKKLAERQIQDKDLEPKLKIDCEIKLKDVTLNLFFLLEKLAPFGLGNPRPVFATNNLEVVSLRRVGREQKHLKFLLDDPETRRLEETLAETEAIAFGFGPRLPTLKVGDRIDVVYNLDLDTWNNQEKLQLKVKDMKLRQ